MLFGELLRRVEHRISQYHYRSFQAGALLSDDAVAEAAELWQAAQPTNAVQPTAAEGQRLADARYALGRLYLLRHEAHVRGHVAAHPVRSVIAFVRTVRQAPSHGLVYQVLPTGADGLSELARAIDYLAPLSHRRDRIPRQFRDVLGAGADANVQAHLGVALMAHAPTTIDPAPLDAAAWLFTAALAAMPPDHPDWVACLENLGAIYRLRFERGGVLADLARAVEAAEQAVAARDGHADHATSLANLAAAYLRRFEAGGVLADLARAVAAAEQAVAATPHHHPRHALYLSYLGLAYRLRFERGGVLADLDKAIDISERAEAGLPHDHPDRAGLASNLGVCYKARFERGWAPDDINQAIAALDQAVAAAPQDQPTRAVFLSNLGVAYRLRFERSGVQADLDQAILCGERAVAAIPDDHPDHATFFSNLAAVYPRRFERSGVLADFDRAIHCGRQAVTRMPRDHPGRAVCLSNLGVAYRLRFERSGVQADLDQAILCGEQAVAAIPDDHPGRPACVSALAAAHLRRFEAGGVLADLDQAIQYGEQAVTATPDNHPEHARWLAVLGLSHLRRFEAGGVLADLDRAILCGQRAVAAIPDDHPDRPACLSNLAVACLRRLEQSGALTDGDQAIDALEQAVATVPHHPDRAGFLSNLGLAHQARFECGGVPADLDEAIQRGQQAVATTPHDHPSQAVHLSNLSTAHLRRFEAGGVLADLDRAILCGQRAVAAIPDDHPDRAVCLSNLADAYQAQWEAGGRRVDRATVRALAAQVTGARTASPPQRVLVGQSVGSLAHAVGEHQLAVHLLDSAVAVLPSVTPREAGWADQEHRLGQHLGLVGEAVAAHCAINDPAGAVEVAEWGRGILLAAHLDSRSDLTDLDDAHPELAIRFRAVRDQLNIPPPVGTPPGQLRLDPGAEIERRRHLWAEHDQVLAQIRQQPGFARFLLAPRLADLRPATAGGAVILVNTGQRRSDAIIITAEADPVPVALDTATFADVQSLAPTWLDAISDGGPAGILGRQWLVPDILGWLWDTVVAPVLGAMPTTAETPSSLPRVWWLPTGPLGLFPLHAAGHPGKPGALDAVISSYTPTLRTLAHARTRPPATVRRQLTVALRHTPGLPDLRGTVAEATALHAHQTDTPLLVDEHATTSSVLAALPAATWAHFACHASADPIIPSRGGLALYDATLTLAQISQLRLGHAELAYLSACSSANRGLRLADESLHLASAFHLAGFRHVIASLWPLDDATAATATAAVYQRLSGTPTADHAPTALHHVTCALRDELREEHAGRPDLWAALIHSGA